MTLQNLLSFVRSHGITAWIAGDVIKGVSVYTYQGRVCEQTTVIGRTLSEVKIWLQY